MKIQLYAVHDSKAHAYMSPILSHNNEMAIRSFSNSVNDPNSEFHKNPLDYSLFHIGTYDDETSLITSKAPPEMLTTADQTIKLYKENQS